VSDTLEGFAVTEAKPEEVGTVLVILNEAADWLQSKGVNQWQSRYFTRPFILEGIGQGEVYLARLDDQIVGTITVQWSDPLWWGDTPMDAAYFHRLAVKREFAAKGFGRALIGWAENKAKAAGKSYLRLNCQFENPRLRQYYEDMGFAFRGDAFLPDGSFRSALYEKKL
jgi:GNAT superfamily N-acetyltransferase